MKRLKLFCAFVTLCNILSAQDYSKRDSIIHLISIQKDDTNKVKMYYEIADLFDSNLPDTAKKYNRLGGVLSEKINYKKGKYKYLRNLSYSCIIKAEYDSTLYYNKIYLLLATQNKDTFDMGKAMFNIGIAYRSKSEYDSAIYYNLEGARMLENFGDLNVKATMLDNLQVLYMIMNQYKKAIDYGEKAIKIARLIKDKNPLVVALNNLALSLEEVNQLEKAKKVLNEAIKIAKEINNKSIEASALNNLAEIAIREGKFDMLLTLSQQSLKINTELNTSYGICKSNLILAIYYMTHGNSEKARGYCNSAMQIAEKDSLMEIISTCNRTLANIEFSNSDFKKGYQYSYISQKIDGEIFNSSLFEKEASLRLKFDNEKKENQIHHLEAEKKIKELTILRKNIFNFILLGGIFWISLISILVYRNLKHRQKLQKQKILELETEKQLAATAAVLKGEEQERTRLAKDLHDGLGGILSGLKYSFITMKGNLLMTPDNQQAFERGMDMLDSSIKEMRRVAHNMMPEALVRFGLNTALSDFCNDINQSSAIAISYQSFGMENIQLDQTVSVTIYRIIQELLNNTLKHAQAQNAIVQLMQNNNLLTITVEDNGKGFDTSILKESRGIGWINIQNRVDFLKGKLDINSKPGEGTSVQIELYI